ncbi:hypothetical protein B9Z55_025230 [Caenorhabditis nigoni]|uniref:F-box domain-containing protein n=1 Tax=Caenorhabditis nigoni TaxID=1611254 RepID=A0A2G5SXS7_9PELO|nr:hypothetical protein B9Z55_025230 [Caenorhabditis nigoni]
MEQNNKKPKEWSDLPEEVQSMVLTYLKFEDMVNVQRSGLIEQVEFKTGYLAYHSHMGQAVIDGEDYPPTFLEEKFPWIKKMVVKMNVLYLNFLPDDVPAFLNAVEALEPFQMRNFEIRNSSLEVFEAVMKRKSGRLDSVCLRGWGYSGYSSDNKIENWMEDIFRSPRMENVPVLMFKELGNVDIVTRLVKFWWNSDVSLDKEAYAYAYNKNSFKPLRKLFLVNGARKPTSRTYVLGMKNMSKQLYLEVFPNKRESRAVFIKVIQRVEAYQKPKVEASIKMWYEKTDDEEWLAASLTGETEDTDDQNKVEDEEGFDSEEDLTDTEL